MMIYRCDRCGRDILRPEGIEPIRYVVDFGTAPYDKYDEEEIECMDICPSCWNSFHHWRHMYLMEDKNE